MSATLVTGQNLFDSESYAEMSVWTFSGVDVDADIGADFLSPQLEPLVEFLAPVFAIVDEPLITSSIELYISNPQRAEGAEPEGIQGTGVVFQVPTTGGAQAEDDDNCDKVVDAIDDMGVFERRDDLSELIWDHRGSTEARGMSMSMDDRLAPDGSGAVCSFKLSTDAVRPGAPESAQLIRDDQWVSLMDFDELVEFLSG